MAKGKKLGAKELQQKLASDSKTRREIFKKLCMHLSAGYSLDCFPDVSLPTIQEMQKSFPEDFPPEELEKALRLGKQGWEDIGRRQANGSCLGNSRTWYYNMSNRYGWRERHDVEAEHKGQVAVNVVSYASVRPSEPPSTSA